MHEGQQVSAPDRPSVYRPMRGAGARAQAKPPCDFAAALLQELTIDHPLPSVSDNYARLESLPADEEAAILRALAGVMPAGYLKRKLGVSGWFGVMMKRLREAGRRCLNVVTVVTASVCSTLLNIDALAIARRLGGRGGGPR